LHTDSGSQEPAACSVRRLSLYDGMRKLPPAFKPYHLTIWFSNKFAYSQICRKVRRL